MSPAHYSAFSFQRGKTGTPAAIAAVVLLFIVAQAGAEDKSPRRAELTELSLEELMDLKVENVYGASKHEQKVTEAPSSITIITSDEIKMYGYRTLADILRGIRGFYVTYDRNYDYIGVRGFSRPGDYNSRVLLLLDGHMINDNIFNSAAIGTEFLLDTDLIERVEVIRGPSSSLYGSNAFFGVVNVITRNGQGLNGVEISGEAASRHTYKGRLSYGGLTGNGGEALLSASAYDSRGGNLYFPEFDSPAMNNGIAEGADYDRSNSYFFKSGSRDFSLEGGYVSRKKGIPTASFGTVFDTRSTFTVDERGFLELKYEHSPTGRLDLSARLSYDLYRYSGDYLYDKAAPGSAPFPVINRDYAEGQWWSGEVKISKELFDLDKLTIGAEFRNNFRQLQNVYDKDPYYQYFRDDRNSDNWGAYIENEFEPAKYLILNTGIRYDHYDTFGDTFNPRLALIYSPFRLSTVKILYGTAYRAPNNYELYYYDGVSIKSNPSLSPEKIETYEIVFEQYMGDHVRGTVSAYHYRIDDLISLQKDPADGFLVYRNMKEVQANGIEWGIEGKWAGGLQGTASYVLQRAEDRQTGEELTNSPRHMAKVNLIVPLLQEKIFAGLEEQYLSGRKTLGENHDPGFLVMNLTLFSRNILKNLEASVSVYNLLDRKYGDPGSEEHIQDIIMQDGRTFRAKLTYTF